MSKARKFVLSVAAVAAVTSFGAPATAGAQDVVPLDSQGSNGWATLYLSGYPSGWNARAWNTVPGGAGLGHFEFTGPNGLHWNSPDRVNPESAVSGTGAGIVCATLWIKQANGSYLNAGRPCNNVY